VGKSADNARNHEQSQLWNRSVVAFAPLGTKTCFNVPEHFSIGKLCKCHVKVLIKIGKVSDFAVSSIPLEHRLKVCMRM
jgi:hypothetical protein